MFQLNAHLCLETASAYISFVLCIDLACTHKDIFLVAHVETEFPITSLQK